MTKKSVVPVGENANAAMWPANPFQYLQNEIDRLFSDFGRNFPSAQAAAVVPSMDIAETDKEIEITAELPGLEENDVQVNVTNNILTIRGEKKSEKKETKDKNNWLVERSYGSFSRSLTLPEGVKADDIKADISKGVLTVKIPKPAPAQSKKIEVKAAA